MYFCPGRCLNLFLQTFPQICMESCRGYKVLMISLIPTLSGLQYENWEGVGGGTKVHNVRWVVISRQLVLFGIVWLVISTGIYFCVFLESRAICDCDIFVIHMQCEWTVFQTFTQLLAITLANVWVPDSPIAKIKNRRNFWTRIFGLFWKNLYPLYGTLVFKSTVRMELNSLTDLG